MEQSTQKHETVVSQAYENALEILAKGGHLTLLHQRVIYEIEHLMQETNSGASYEQYFRRAGIDEISSICDTLNRLALGDVADLTSEAINIAFPGGIPNNDEGKSRLTDWS